jgi:hypothetical protein
VTQVQDVEAPVESNTAQSEQGPVSGPEAPSADLAELVPAAEPAAAAPSAAVAPPDDLPAQAETPATAMVAAGENEPQWTPATDGGAAIAVTAATATAITATAATARAAGAPPRDALMPSLELTQVGGLPPTSPDVQAALMARWRAPTQAFLPELDLGAQWPDFGAAPASAVLPAASQPPEALAAALPRPAWLALEPATDFDGKVSTVPEPAEPSGLSPAPAVPEDPSSAQPADAEDLPTWPVDQPPPGEPAAEAPMPQPPDGDPLAALKAMSDDELIALFS